MPTKISIPDVNIYQPTMRSHLIEIKDSSGIVVDSFEAAFPDGWSDTACNIAGQHYLAKGANYKEFSILDTFNRVAGRIAEWGVKDGYFNKTDSKKFKKILVHYLINQKAAFNSPVFYNIGRPDRKESASACYINSIKDDMASIMELLKTEAMLFKGGSGSGVNISPLRAKDEPLTTGGTASGPLSFMVVQDANGGAMKSGGGTRRSAAMRCMDVDHPDIEEFVSCKVTEEKKAHALIDAGFDGSFEGEAYKSIKFQNANHSVRATDAFMEAVKGNTPWSLSRRVDGKCAKSINASKLFNDIAKATHFCGDPGIQFTDTINKWHTCPQSGSINASNPCSEYLFLDDSACNLASLNITKFFENGRLVMAHLHACIDIFILAMDILVGNSHYPTRQIQSNSHKFRPLGLGFTNLGGLLMRLGVPYDSDKGRCYASEITSLLTSLAYLRSAEIAKIMGPFEGFTKNKDSMISVIKRHRDNSSKTQNPEVTNYWEQAIISISEHGVRNAQVTVLAPTGTISFMMDADTTGIEPAFSLISYKTLVGGGVMKLVNGSVKEALSRMNYSLPHLEAILDHLRINERIEDAPFLMPHHLPIFDCASRATGGKRLISPDGHLKMMASCQPFLSGSISKTINVDSSASVNDIEELYMRAWEMGIKAVAIYRDGSKRIQPLSTNVKIDSPEILTTAQRRKLPVERPGVNRKLKIGGAEFYIWTSTYEDGSIGEVFIQANKGGSMLGGFSEALGACLSIGLQYGIPLKVFVDKLKGVRCEPSGFTNDNDIKTALSPIDYVAKHLERKYLFRDKSKDAQTAGGTSSPSTEVDYESPCCSKCGGRTRLIGTCYTCLECGTTTGCS